MKGYDKLSVNHQVLLDLPFREGSGTITHDVSKVHHQPITLQDPGAGSFNWTSIASGLPCLELVTVGFGAADGVYLDCPAAGTGDLDFTSGDYSVACWVNHRDTGHFKPKIIVGRYGVDLDGWEVYLESDTGLVPPVHYLEHRHHHATLGAGNLRDGCYSTGWTPDSGWSLIGISRSGLYPKHYRNGLPMDMSYGADGMRDPDTCNRDLVIGARFTKDQDWYYGYMCRLRVWDSDLSASEWLQIFNYEKHWYGVS